LWTAENYRWQGRADDAHTLSTAVRDSALTRGDTPMRLSSTVGLGHALLAQERDAEAVTMYNTMIGIAHRTGDWMNKGRAYLGMAEATFDNEQTAMPMNYYKIAIRTLSEHEPTAVLVQALRAYAYFRAQKFGGDDPEIPALDARAAQLESELED
jgi:hypothetical protein